MANLCRGTDHAVRCAPPDLAYLEQRSGGKIRMNTGSLRFWIAAVLMLATALLLQAHSRSEYFPPRAPRRFLPLQIHPWTVTDIVLNRQTLAIAHPAAVLLPV